MAPFKLPLITTLLPYLSLFLSATLYAIFRTRDFSLTSPHLFRVIKHDTRYTLSNPSGYQTPFFSPALMSATAAAPAAATGGPVGSASSGIDITREVILLDEGWDIILKSGLRRLESLVESLGRSNNNSTTNTNASSSLSGGSAASSSFADACPVDDAAFSRDAAPLFTPRESMGLYSLIYQLCIQKAPHCYTPNLYTRLVAHLDDYLTSTVFTAIRDKQGAAQLTELVLRWRQFEVYQRWICVFFQYLDRYYVDRYKKLKLYALCSSRFEHLVFQPLSNTITATLITAFQELRSAAVESVLQHEKSSRAATTATIASSSSSLSAGSAAASGKSASSFDPAMLTFASPMSVLLRQVLAVHVSLDTERLRVYIVRAEQPLIHNAASYYASLAPQWLAEPGTCSYCSERAFKPICNVLCQIYFNKSSYTDTHVSRFLSFSFSLLHHREPRPQA